ncbi:MAG: hypothetical protein OQK24_12750 [Magnetovibrio sp.]|nr:hypothetical protein [Magnetovibrio sp.]
MAIGKSGRIVIEIDPEIKARIHNELKIRGLTLREWFLAQAERDGLAISKKKVTAVSKKMGAKSK